MSDALYALREGVGMGLIMLGILCLAGAPGWGLIMLGVLCFVGACQANRLRREEVERRR